MAIIPAFFRDAVVALGILLPNGEKHWVGTGILVGRKEISDSPNSTKFTVYIVTNKHVVHEQTNLFVRFNTNTQMGVKDLSMRLRDGQSLLYSSHPNQQVDIVAIQIIPQVIIDNGLSLSFFDESDHMLALTDMQKTGVDEGSLVYAMGFPMNLVDDKIKAPICRLGCISRVADAFSAPDKAVSFLVDAQTFPGNSGGPIISRPETISISGTPSNSAAYLIGILSAFIPYRDTLVSLQTKQNVMIREENSGLTIVHPVDRIKEVVELEWNRQNESRKKANEKTSLLQTQKEDMAV